MIIKPIGLAKQYYLLEKEQLRTRVNCKGQFILLIKMRSFTRLRKEPQGKNSKFCSTQICYSRERRTVRQSQGDPFTYISRDKFQSANKAQKLRYSVAVNNSSVGKKHINLRNVKRFVLSSKSRNANRTEEQKLISRHSDKMKLVYCGDSIPETITNCYLVVAADFIIDQDSFWKEEVINPTIIKNWKILHQKYTIFWTIRRQSSLQKIKRFCKLNDLPLNCIYLIRRSGHFTVNYSSTIKDVLIYQNNRPKTEAEMVSPEIVIMDCIKSNSLDVCGFETYKGRVPIISGKESVSVGLVRVSNSASGLQAVISIADKVRQMNKCQGLKTFEERQAKSIPLFIQEYFSKIVRSGYPERESIMENNQKLGTFQANSNLTKDTDNQEYDEEEAQLRFQEFRRQLVNDIIDKKGRAFKIDGNSIHYVVGDLLKRNYSNLLDRIGKDLIASKTRKKANGEKPKFTLQPLHSFQHQNQSPEVVQPGLSFSQTLNIKFYEFFE